MARCETTHWTLDCGEGHGCYLIEWADTGKVAAWGCASEPVTGRPKPQGNQPAHLDTTARLTFCCGEMSRGALAEALKDLVPHPLVVPKGKEGEKVSHCATGTLGEVLQALGFSASR